MHRSIDKTAIIGPIEYFNLHFLAFTAELYFRSYEDCENLRTKLREAEYKLNTLKVEGEMSFERTPASHSPPLMFPCFMIFDQISAPIEHGNVTSLPLQEIMTYPPTDRPTDGHEDL